jgi:hypothetical protein
MTISISAHFNGVRPRTRSDYKKLGAKFRAEFDQVPIALWKDSRSRKKLRKFKDGIFMRSPRQADYMWSFISAVFSLAVDDRELAVNPAAVVSTLGHALTNGRRLQVGGINFPPQPQALLKYYL